MSELKSSSIENEEMIFTPTAKEEDLEQQNDDILNPKRKLEDSKETAVKKQKKILTYIPWEYLTPSVLKACVRGGDPYVPSGKAAMTKIMFDYTKFATLCPSCPEIRPKKNKVLYTNHPFLKSSFGYSPYLGEDGKVANQLRFEFDDYISNESRRFKGEMTKSELEERERKLGGKYYNY